MAETTLNGEALGVRPCVPCQAVLHTRWLSGETIRSWVIVLGRRANGDYLLRWDDEPNFGINRGQLCWNSPEHVDALAPLLFAEESQ